MSREKVNHKLAEQQEQINQEKESRMEGEVMAEKARPPKLTIKSPTWDHGFMICFESDNELIEMAYNQALEEILKHNFDYCFHQIGAHEKGLQGWEVELDKTIKKPKEELQPIRKKIYKLISSFHSRAREICKTDYGVEIADIDQ